MKWVFWVSLALIIYTMVGYPVLLYLRSRWRARPVCTGCIVPYLSIVMAVRNEERVLLRKLRNLAEINYPSDRYEIVVVSDGSTDDTNRMLADQQDERLRVVLLPQHEGKAAALNRGIEVARGEIVVFTDARQRIEQDAINRLAANFADPNVGCVSGDITLGDPHATAPANGVGVYWRVETNIRRWEGATGSLIGAAGCLYAVRRELVVPLPVGTILDDVYLPLHVARQGAWVVYESRARGWDEVPADWRREFQRKVRTLIGNYQLLRLAPWLLTRANPVRFEFISHKLLRLVLPFALGALLVSPLFLHGVVYELALALQVVFYVLPVMVFFRPKLGIISRMADVSFAFVVLNTAAVVALVYFVIGKNEVWVR